MKKQPYKPTKRELEKRETKKRDLIRKNKAGFFNPKTEL